MKLLLCILALAISCTDVFTYLSYSSYSKCPYPSINNGSLRIRQRGNFVKFICRPRYMLMGNMYATCRNGRWDVPLPVCIKPGCGTLEVVKNSVVQSYHSDAWVLFFCFPGYTLVGSPVVYCDGRHWNATVPQCIDTLAPIKTSCDFEDPDICGWKQDELHDFNWRRLSKRTPSSFLFTGPQYDHTLGKNGSGYYMYIESTSRIVNDTARLISPVFDKKLLRDGCFVFHYHMYESFRDIGGLRVYQKPNEINLYDVLSYNLNGTNKYRLFDQWGNLGNFWYTGVVSLLDVNDDFQIVIEGIRGKSFMSVIAIDDIAVLQGANCTDAMHGATTPQPRRNTTREPLSSTDTPSDYSPSTMTTQRNPFYSHNAGLDLRSRNDTRETRRNTTREPLSSTDTPSDYSPSTMTTQRNPFYSHNAGLDLRSRNDTWETRRNSTREPLSSTNTSSDYSRSGYDAWETRRNTTREPLSSTDTPSDYSPSGYDAWKMRRSTTWKPFPSYYTSTPRTSSGFSSWNRTKKYYEETSPTRKLFDSYSPRTSPPSTTDVYRQRTDYPTGSSSSTTWRPFSSSYYTSKPSPPSGVDSWSNTENSEASTTTSTPYYSLKYYPESHSYRWVRRSSSSSTTWRPFSSSYYTSKPTSSGFRSWNNTEKYSEGTTTTWKPFYSYSPRTSYPSTEDEYRKRTDYSTASTTISTPYYSYTVPTYAPEPYDYRWIRRGFLNAITRWSSRDSTTTEDEIPTTDEYDYATDVTTDHDKESTTTSVPYFPYFIPTDDPEYNDFRWISRDEHARKTYNQICCIKGIHFAQYHTAEEQCNNVDHIFTHNLRSNYKCYTIKKFCCWKTMQSDENSTPPGHYYETISGNVYYKEGHLQGVSRWPSVYDAVRLPVTSSKYKTTTTTDYNYGTETTTDYEKGFNSKTSRWSSDYSNVQDWTRYSSPVGLYIPGRNYKYSKDIDECAENIHNCSIFERCVNTNDSFECYCIRGYARNYYQGPCVDINECRENTHNCGINEKCLNTNGSFECICAPGYKRDYATRDCVGFNNKTSHWSWNNSNVQDWTRNTSAVGIYVPRRNYKYSKDIDQCAENIHNCSIFERCVNINDSFKCFCRYGYERIYYQGNCVDVNECQRGIHNCGINEKCLNTNGSFECICAPGYKRDYATRDCVDINECREYYDNCSMSETCFNTNGSYECQCARGYERNYSTGYCVDIDECALDIHNCTDSISCNNTIGSFNCIYKGTVAVKVQPEWNNKTTLSSGSEALPNGQNKETAHKPQHLETQLTKLEQPKSQPVKIINYIQSFLPPWLLNPPQYPQIQPGAEKYPQKQPQKSKELIPPARSDLAQYLNFFIVNNNN